MDCQKTFEGFGLCSKNGMSVDHHLWVFSIHPYKTETRQNTPLSLMCGQLCGKYYFDKVKQNTSSGFITGVKACSEILSLTLI